MFTVHSISYCVFSVLSTLLCVFTVHSVPCVFTVCWVPCYVCSQYIWYLVCVHCVLNTLLCVSQYIQYLVCVHSVLSTLLGVCSQCVEYLARCMFTVHWVPGSPTVHLLYDIPGLCWRRFEPEMETQASAAHHGFSPSADRLLCQLQLHHHHRPQAVPIPLRFWPGFR